MKYFDIFKHPNGDVKAFKQGWCWPGFFFTWIWAFVKGHISLGAGLLLAGIIMGFLNLGSAYLSALGSFGSIILCIWIGAEGNKILGRHFEEKRYEYNGYTIAKNGKEAINRFKQGKVSI